MLYWTYGAACAVLAGLAAWWLGLRGLDNPLTIPGSALLGWCLGWAGGKLWWWSQR